jgi:hypothetical protein
MTDLAGRIFGRMTVIGPADQDLPYPRRLGLVDRPLRLRPPDHRASRGVPVLAAHRLRPPDPRGPGPARGAACRLPVPSETVIHDHHQTAQDLDAAVAVERFRRADCACDDRLPCLLHFDDLDWQGRVLASDLGDIKPAAGR